MTSIFHSFEVGVLVGAVGVVAVKYVAKKGWAVVVAQIAAAVKSV